MNFEVGLEKPDSTITNSMPVTGMNPFSLTFSTHYCK